MKKLNLEKLKLAAEDVLQCSQIGIIYGGSGGGCRVQCDNWENYWPLDVPHFSQGDILYSGGYQCYHC